jgi:hypothetical protein
LRHGTPALVALFELDELFLASATALIGQVVAHKGLVVGVAVLPP